MGISISLLLAAVGAVLLFAVDNDVDGVDFDAIGVILLIIAGVGLIWSLFITAAENEDSHFHRRHRGHDDD